MVGNKLPISLDLQTDLVEAKVDTRKQFIWGQEYHRTKEVGQSRDDL